MLRILILPAFLLLASVAEASERIVTLTIENMTCAACPTTVRTAIERVAGVKDVEIDFKKKIAVVIYDDEQATVEDLAEASRLAGFPAAKRD